MFDGNNGHIAYRKLQGKKASVVFFGGFASNMDGTKATAIYKFCQENDIALVLFDYFGHGHSSGNFIDYTISDWQKNCAKVISELTSDKQIIIGSSMGGWLMLLTALQFPEKNCSINRHMESRPVELPHQSLAKLYVNLSIYTASIIQPFGLTLVSSDRKYPETSFSPFLEIVLLVFRDS
ncbi:alpha/beta fold hydrolase [Wolbachia endosymbiont (group A) of Longitarsus flavicornis]|uniref:alpha/beta fold hydrolase n=1 Tax=Wolbachia endosymbiont (group A) of Longitarsus flavicornis TaxID=3066134 RepID=UPI00397BE2B7